MPLVVDFAQDPYFARLFRKIRDEGRAEGRAESRAKGEALLLLRLLERRFGPLPADLRSRILAFDSQAREACADRIFDAPTLAAVLGDPPLHQPIAEDNVAGPRSVGPVSPGSPPPSPMTP